MKLIEDGCLSKAMCYLGSLGLGDLELGPIKAQLRRLHPQHRRAWGVDLRYAPRAHLGSPAAVLKNLRRRAGTGVDSGRNWRLIRLVRGIVPDSVRVNALSAWALFADRVADGDFPVWFYLAFTSVRQLAPIKEKGASPSENDVRPVGCESSNLRAITGMVKVVAKQAQQNHCGPV